MKSVPNSPWASNISGVEVNLLEQLTPAPSTQTLAEIQRIWEREN